MLKTITQPSADQPELVAAVKAELTEMAGQRKNPIGDFKPKGPGAGQQVLDELIAVNATLSAKATPEEAAAFRALAEQGSPGRRGRRERGGLHGHRRDRVSEREQQMLEEIAKALSA